MFRGLIIIFDRGHVGRRKSWEILTGFGVRPMTVIFIYISQQHFVKGSGALSSLSDNTRQWLRDSEADI